jgi:hypothetical protein
VENPGKSAFTPHFNASRLRISLSVAEAALVELIRETMKMSRALATTQQTNHWMFTLCRSDIGVILPSLVAEFAASQHLLSIRVVIN